jgi:S-adenosyl methyltransferase
VAHPARVYDYWLGGKDNFPADREAAEQVIAVNPNVLHGVRANRAFLGRAVSYLTREAGIRQFLDLGTGLPTAGNTHQVAQAIAPDTRVIYVDNDHCKSGCTHACAGFGAGAVARGFQAARVITLRRMGTFRRLAQNLGSYTATMAPGVPWVRGNLQRLP